MVKQKNVIRSLIFFALLIAATYIPMFLREKVLDAFTREDNIYETLSPLYLSVACIMFIIAFLRSRAKLNLKDPAFLKKMAFLGFAVIFFLATMEEISWGQRFLDIKTPEAISEANAQKELTFHNLKIFQGDDAIIPLDFDQLSAAFALFFGFLIPVVCELSRPLKQFVASRFPVLPVLFGLLFAENYLIQKAFVRILPLFPSVYHGSQRIPIPIHEIREHNYALLLMVSSIFYLLLQLDLSPTPQLQDTAPAKVKAEGDVISHPPQ